MKPARGVDTHAHVFSATAPAVAGARYRPGYAASLEAWQAHWPAAGVSHGVLVQPSFFGTDNAEVEAALARDPERLRGVAVLDPSVPENELARLDEAGFRALRLNLIGVRDYAQFASGEWVALFARLARRGWHIETFVERGRLPEIVPALRQADVPIVCDHFGHAGADGEADATFAAVERLQDACPVYCKLSGPYRVDGGDALARRWIEAVGESRVVWGSDWPWTGHEASNDYATLRRCLDDWVGEARAARVLWDNAAALYGFS